MQAAFLGMVDPHDTKALQVIEDTLDLHCFCRSKPSPFCPVHNNGAELLAALEHLSVEKTEAIEEAEEAKEKECEEGFSDTRKELADAEEKVDALETRESKLTGLLSDVQFDLEKWAGLFKATHPKDAEVMTGWAAQINEILK